MSRLKANTETWSIYYIWFVCVDFSTFNVIYTNRISSSNGYLPLKKIRTEKKTAFKCRDISQTVNYPVFFGLSFSLHGICWRHWKRYDWFCITNVNAIKITLEMHTKLLWYISSDSYFLHFGSIMLQFNVVFVVHIQ